MPVPANRTAAASANRQTVNQNRHASARIVIVNDVYHPAARDLDALLDRFTTLTGWAGALRIHGAEVAVCQRFHRVGRIERDAVTYHFVTDTYAAQPPTWFPGNERTLEIAAQLTPDVVHVNGLNYPRAIRNLRRRLPKETALAVQDHGGFDPGQLSMPRRWWMRAGLGAADALLVATPGQTRQFLDSGLVPSSVAVYDVMEGSTMFGTGRDSDPGSRRNVLWVGRLDANKDPLTVLDGFARFARTSPTATLTFVYSEGQLEGALRDAIAARPDLAGRVTLAGAVPHEALERLLGSSDILVLGSHREGSGYAVLEALACGVVPVVTDIPSFRGLTDNGRVGILWEPGNPQSLALALASAAQDYTLARLRTACQRRFEECYSWEAIGRRAIAIYREVSER